MAGGDIAVKTVREKSFLLSFQSGIETTLEKLLRNGMEGIWAPPSAYIPSLTELTRTEVADRDILTATRFELYSSGIKKRLPDEGGQSECLFTFQQTH